MPKPSERIWEIFRERKSWSGNRNDINDLGDNLEAIIQYLDEQYASQDHKGENLPKDIERIRGIICEE